MSSPNPEVFIDRLLKDAQYVLSAPDVQTLPAPIYAEVAFAGKSNVGKSSLLNAMTRRKKLARTSSTPGCTRAINLFRITLRNAFLDLVDLPGYGFAKRSKEERRKWARGIEGFFRFRAGLRAVVVLIDVRRGVSEDDQMLIDFAIERRISVVLAATKIDKLSSSERSKCTRELKKSFPQTYFVSARTGEGLVDLWKAVLRETHIAMEEAPA